MTVLYYKNLAEAGSTAGPRVEEFFNDASPVAVGFLYVGR